MHHPPQAAEAAGRDFTGGGILGMPRRPVTTGDKRLDAIVHELVAQHGGLADEALIEELVVNALRFARYEISIADLKLINRTLRELRSANRVFFPYRNRHKVVIYGSARTHPEQAEAKAAEEFARRMVEMNFMVITGAGEGIMGAGQKGAGRENSFGLNIKLPFEQEANETIEGDKKLVNFNYFFTRKLTFVKEAEAVALFPGGFGTMDECFELLTLIQTGKSQIIPILMVDAPDGTYWKTFSVFLRDHLLRRRLISEGDFSLFHITDDVAEAAEHIRKFYRVFHSYRYVREQIAIRLHRRIRPEEVYILNKQFPDLVLEGTIEQGTCLEAERDEPELATLPRLVFKPKRGNYGRLRELIDAVNAAEFEPS
ncbi:MAG: LOG family protein [Verrucomicrobiales bacterium]|nr:LOG family protein [Verrucomicrobiales bacterium]